MRRFLHILLAGSLSALAAGQAPEVATEPVASQDDALSSAREFVSSAPLRDTTCPSRAWRIANDERLVAAAVTAYSKDSLPEVAASLKRLTRTHARRALAFQVLTNRYPGFDEPGLLWLGLSMLPDGLRYEADFQSGSDLRTTVEGNRIHTVAVLQAGEDLRARLEGHVTPELLRRAYALGNLSVARDHAAADRYESALGSYAVALEIAGDRALYFEAASCALVADDRDRAGPWIDAARALPGRTSWEEIAWERTVARALADEERAARLDAVFSARTEDIGLERDPRISLLIDAAGSLSPGTFVLHLGTRTAFAIVHEEPIADDESNYTRQLAHERARRRVVEEMSALVRGNRIARVALSLAGPQHAGDAGLTWMESPLPGTPTDAVLQALQAAAAHPELFESSRSRARSVVLFDAEELRAAVSDPHTWAESRTFESIACTENDSRDFDVLRRRVAHTALTRAILRRLPVAVAVRAHRAGQWPSARAADAIALSVNGDPDDGELHVELLTALVERETDRMRSEGTRARVHVARSDAPENAKWQNAVVERLTALGLEIVEADDDDGDVALRLDMTERVDNRPRPGNLAGTTVDHFEAAVGLWLTGSTSDRWLPGDEQSFSVEGAGSSFTSRAKALALGREAAIDRLGDGCVQWLARGIARRAADGHQLLLEGGREALERWAAAVDDLPIWLETPLLRELSDERYELVLRATGDVTEVSTALELWALPSAPTPWTVVDEQRARLEQPKKN
ncbi:MAG: hypothetical protein GY711_09935 [bacterium]|nr:hypothetical protein [bacterium]